MVSEAPKLTVHDWKERRDRFEAVYERHIRGLSQRQIAEELGLSASRVNQLLVLYKQGEVYRSVREVVELRCKDTWRTKEVLSQHEQGISAGRIANTLSISLSSVRSIVRLWA